MANPVQGLLKRFSAPSHNQEFARQMLALADVAVACMRHFRETKGQDLAGVIEFEHQGDRLVDAIHELLDNAFIFRFDISDAMKLTDDLDDVIDGMRKAAAHIDIYNPVIGELRPEALDLVRIGEGMIGELRVVIAMLAEPRLTLARVREVARVIDEGEGRADQVVIDAEKRLVREFAPAGANRLAFIAWDKLFQLLEETTDEINRCAKQVLSLARKESLR